MGTNEGRYWHIVAFYQNLKNAGLTDEQIEDPQYVAEFFLKRWKGSGKNRIGCITVCMSKEGAYHVHGLLCGEKTTLSGVSKTMFNAHVEKCMGGKRVLMEYIQKKGEYAQIGEKVLAQACDKEMERNQGYRSDLKHYQELMDEGYTPEEIFHDDIRALRSENAILRWYAIKKNQEEAVKSAYVEWHIGETETGKSHYYDLLCDEYGIDSVFYIGDLENGWIDNYVEKGCPQILFIDDLASPCEIVKLLSVVDAHSNKAIHARYRNVYPRWKLVFITSLEPPEKIFGAIVHTAYYRKLLRKIDYFVYHFIKENRICSYRLPSEQYSSYGDLQQNALINKRFTKHRNIYVVDESTIVKEKDDHDK